MERKKLSQRLAQITIEQPECTIYRVHNHLRNVNPKAYDPEVMAIGPYHHGNRNIKMLEEHKLLYLHMLLEGKNENLESYVSVIKPFEQKARKCYAEDLSITPSEFIEMLVLDGCFIIQLVRKFSTEILRAKNDTIFNMDWVLNSLKRDLMLFENQIPFFILVELFKLIEGPDLEKLMELLFFFFESQYPGNGYRNESRNAKEIKHILDLVHGNWNPRLPSPPSDHLLDIGSSKDMNGSSGIIERIKDLKEANVEFVKADNKGSLFTVEFKNGKMTLAPIRINDSTESFLRNLIAFEQYFKNSETRFVTCYALLLDSLIDTSKDVEILCNSKIIDNFQGDDKRVADMLSKLTDWVSIGNRFAYDTVVEQANTHCNHRRNTYWAALRHKYLGSPWAILSIVAGLMILLLTFVQAVCSILQVLPKNQ